MIQTESKDDEVNDYVFGKTFLLASLDLIKHNVAT